MIAEPIKTAFPWYDDILKQNRYKEQCVSSCNYKLLTPINTIPPFEIRTNEYGISFVSWKIFCAEDDTEIIDISTHITIGNAIEIVTIAGQDYIVYSGAALTETFFAPALILECGTYYSVLETNEASYYSELFSVENGVIDVDFNQTVFPLYTPWGWYDNQEKQNRYKEQCLANCDFCLLTGNDALLPFMFRKPSMSNVINSWVLRSLDGVCEHNLDTSPLNIAVFGVYDYVYYNGTDIDNLPCGTFESIITINGLNYYSEIIKITNDISSNGDQFYILQENGAKILQENSFGILQE